jgi:hypothetical protein
VSDFYQIHIPADAPAGLYWPRVGLYDSRTIALLPVTNAAGDELSDSQPLSPLKVMSPNPPTPQHLVSAHFGDTATLLGYDLDLPLDGLHPGGSFSLTLYLRSDQPTRADYTRFVHLLGADQSVAAQVDSRPQQGLNPTWSWVPGEVIVDRFNVALAPQAASGAYRLQIGLYDPGADGARLPAFDSAGNPLPDGSVTLAELQIEP